MCVCVCVCMKESRSQLDGGESLFETHEAAVNKVGVLSGRAPRRLVVVVLLLLQDPGGEGSPPYSSNVLRNGHLGRQREHERERYDLCRATGRHLAARQSTQTCLTVFTIIAAMTAVHVIQSKDDAVDNLTQCAAVAQFLRLAASPREIQDVTTKFGSRVGVGA